MKRDITEQFLKFTGQDGALPDGNFKYTSSGGRELCWVSLLDKDEEIECTIWSNIRSNRKYNFESFSIILSDFFWDINSPSKEELELFLIEHPEVHQRLFVSKQHG